jgi:hypothetical protein
VAVVKTFTCIVTSCLKTLDQQRSPVSESRIGKIGAEGLSAVVIATNCFHDIAHACVSYFKRCMHCRGSFIFNVCLSACNYILLDYLAALFQLEELNRAWWNELLNYGESLDSWNKNVILLWRYLPAFAVRHKKYENFVFIAGDSAEIIIGHLPVTGQVCWFCSNLL